MSESQRRGLLLLGAALLVGLAGCAAKRPVLYPNPHLQDVGPEIAAMDIEDCLARADGGVGDVSGAETVAKDTAGGAGAGGAIGAAGGAVVGHAGRGAAIGAATGATRGLIRGIFSSRNRDPIYMAYANRCLRDRGYDVIGWR
jgi:outer membrane lipoprotein SlyB